MIPFNKDLLMGDIPEGWILHVYMSDHVEVLLKDDKGTYAVASFDIDDRHCTNAMAYRTYIEAASAFREFIRLDFEAHLQKEPPMKWVAKKFELEEVEMVIERKPYEDMFLNLLTII